MHAMGLGRGTHQRWLRLAVLVGGLAVLVGVPAIAASLQHGPSRQPVFESVSNALTVVSLIVSGVLAWGARPGNRTGPLLALAGICWGASSTQAPPALWFATFAPLLAGLAFALVGHALLAFPSGRLRTRPLRLAVFAVYVAPVGGFLAGRISCNYNCGRDILAIPALAPAAAVLTTVIAASWLLVALWVFLLVRWRWREASEPGRRVLAPVVMSGLAAAATIILVQLLATVGADGSGAYAVQSVGVALVPLGFLAGLLRTRVTRSSLGELVVALSQSISGRDQRDLLARALGDDSLQVGYWVGGAQGVVDADGRPLELDRHDASRAVTDISGEDGPLAVLVHDPALCDDEGLLDAVAGAAQLSLENERLAAQVRAQLDAVRDSRRRIVRAGEREQLRIERDLHRGAVQRLVGVSLALRMAADEAGEDPGTLALLNSAIGEAQGALVDLRELARGLHPEILTQDGLDAALRTLADRSPLPVHADLSVSTRLDPGVEGCAYFVCSEAFANIDKYAHATKVGLRIGLSAGHLVMTVSDDGVGGAHLGNGSGLIGLRDRVQALGGVLAVDSAPGQGTTIEMRLPAIVVAAPALA